MNRTKKKHGHQNEQKKIERDQIPNHQGLMFFSGYVVTIIYRYTV